MFLGEIEVLIPYVLLQRDQETCKEPETSDS